MAGADANPYLVAAAVLTSLLNGIEKEIAAPDPIEGDSYTKNFDQIPSDWRTAIGIFRNGAFNRDFYSSTFIEVLSNLKMQELNTFEDRMEDFEVRTYLDVF